MTNQPLSPEQPLQALALQAPTGYWRGSSSGPATESQKTRHLPLPQHPLSHIQTHTHALPHTLTCAHPLTHTCTHTNAHFGTGTHIDTHTHTHTHTHTETQVKEHRCHPCAVCTDLCNPYAALRTLNRGRAMSEMASIKAACVEAASTGQVIVPAPPCSCWPL